MADSENDSKASIEPEAPSVLRKLEWLRLHWRKHLGKIIIAGLLIVSAWFVSHLSVGRGSQDGPLPPVCQGGLCVVAALPNPVGDDRVGEEVHVANLGDTAISLARWTVEDAGGSGWDLDAQDGVVQPGDTLRILRRRRGRGLNNQGRETITLVDPERNRVHSVSYTGAEEGELIRFTTRPPG